MFTLTKASKETKIIIKILVIAIAVIVLIALLVRLWMYLFPAPKPKPTVAFGKIISANFPKSVQTQDFTYSINTLSGFLPKAVDQLNVYPIIKYKPDLLALSNTQALVNETGFTNGPIKISDELYNWSDNSTELSKTLQVNIVNHNFSATSNFYLDPQITSLDNSPSQSDALSTATDFLQKMNSLPDDIDTSQTQETNLSIKNNSLVLATSISNTQLIRVNFNQSDVDGLRVYYQDPNESNVSVLVGGGSDKPQIVQATYIHQAIDTQSATYPIKTTQQAFAQLQKGQGYIASYYGTNKKIAVRDVSIGYYISRQDQDYLIPIFVFEGDDGFIAYVNAITDEWTGN